MNTQTKIVIALTTICFILILVKTKSSTIVEKMPDFKCPPSSESSGCLGDKSIVFEDATAIAEDVLKPGMAITAPADIIIEEGDPCGYFLNEEKTYFFAIWIKPKDNRRIIKKGTKLTIRKVIKESVHLSSEIDNSPEASSTFKVRTPGDDLSFYIDIAAGDYILLRKYNGYVKFNSDKVRDVTIADILKYSDIVEVPNSAEIIK